MDLSKFRRKRHVTESDVDLKNSSEINQTFSQLRLFQNKSFYGSFVKKDSVKRKLSDRVLNQTKSKLSKTQMKNYLQILKGNFETNTLFNKQNSKSKIINISKLHRKNCQNILRKSSKQKFYVTLQMKQSIQKLLNTYRFAEQIKMSHERIAKLIKLASNQDRILCKIFLDVPKFTTKQFEFKSGIVFSRDLLISRLQESFPFFKKRVQEVQIIISLFCEKMDNFVHEIDNNTIKDLQNSIIKYNTIVGCLMPDAVMINKKRYFYNRNILTQIDRSQKFFGQCKNISKMSRNRYQLLNVVMSGIKNHPDW